MSERNDRDDEILFGILAHRAGFLSHDQFLSLCEEWLTCASSSERVVSDSLENQRRGSFAKFLIQQGCLTED